MLLILKTLNIKKPQEELEVDEIYENSPDNYLKDFMVFKIMNRSSSHMPKDLHQVLTAIILKLEKIESGEICSKELETTLRSLQKKFFKTLKKKVFIQLQSQVHSLSVSSDPTVAERVENLFKWSLGYHIESIEEVPNFFIHTTHWFF